MSKKGSNRLLSILLVLSLVLTVIPLASPALAATLLSDNFDSYTAFPSGGWTNASLTGTWGIATDGTKVANQTSTSSSKYYMVNGQSTWGNYTYSAKVKVSNTSTRAGLLGRYKDANNYYALYLYNGRIMLDRRFNSSTSTLQQVNFVANSSTFYTLKLELNGSSIKGYINDTLYISYTDSSIATGKVGFYGHNGAAKYDDVLVVDSSTVTVPAAPTGLTATAGNAQVSLSWTASTGASTYNVKRSTTNGSGYTNVATGITSTSYLNTGLTNGTTYYYVVTAVNSGGESGNSNQASATPTGTVTIPAAPTGLTAAASNASVNLSWTASSGATSYTVKRSTTSGSGYTNVATGITSTSYLNTGLTNGTTYYYVVTAVNSGGESGNSNQASATPTASSSSYDAGLNTTFQYPSAVTGATISVLSYGATPNNAADDDFTAFQNAINAANAGDEVYVPNGTYHFKTRKIQLKTGVSLRGQDKNNAILSSNFNSVTDNPGSYIIGALPGVNNLTISNLKFNMYGGQSLRYPIWLGADPASANVSRIAVQDCIVEGFEKMAISVRNGNHILIKNNIIRNASALGGGGEGYGVMLGYSNSHNNWVTGNYIGPVIRHAVLIQYNAHHNLVENNTADSSSEDAYDLHGEDEYSNELRYNKAFGGEASGFGIGNTGSTHYDSGPKNWIHHNEVWNSAQGINIINESHQQYIEDNNFHHNDDLGIKVYSGAGRNLVFKRNTVQFNQAGARFEDDASGLVFDANIVTNNTGYSIKTMSATTGYTITNNDFRFNGSPAEITSSDGTYSGNLE